MNDYKKVLKEAFWKKIKQETAFFSILILIITIFILILTK